MNIDDIMNLMKECCDKIAEATNMEEVEIYQKIRRDALDRYVFQQGNHKRHESKFL
jgi:hypothetical protein